VLITHSYTYCSGVIFYSQGDGHCVVSIARIVLLGVVVVVVLIAHVSFITPNSQLLSLLFLVDESFVWRIDWRLNRLQEAIVSGIAWLKLHVVFWCRQYHANRDCIQTKVCVVR
jgi:hypothetical protein